VVGGADPTPPPEQLRRLLRLGSLVVDLSQRAPDDRGLETRHVLHLLAEHRRRHGTPHWIILDEAHLVPDLSRVFGLAPGRYAAGICAVTWRPDRLSPDTLAAMDYTVLFPGLHRAGAAALGDAGFPLPAGADPPVTRGRIEGLLLDRRAGRQFVSDARTSQHLRHWHKYQSAELPYHQRFFFRLRERLTGAVAGSMADFHDEIARADLDVLRHHARNRDFSRWTEDVVRDHQLAELLRQVEEQLGRNGGGTPEAARRQLLDAIETHYQGKTSSAP
jgi:hypothetical protein